jgi:Heterokaryon incompatibility protein (HET)
MTAIDLNSLPKTFQDAITTTRALSIDYIWIDSLCIVQDDVEDWEREAANMAGIYESAEVTIAAAWGSNGSCGCFHDPLPTFMADVYNAEHSSNEPTSQLYMRLDPRGERTLARAILTTRKWTLQESLLSPRTLIFAKDQMYWTCASLEESEDGLTQGLDSSFTKWRSVLSPEADDASQRSVEERNKSWTGTVNNYGARNLSFASDKLAAFAGVTKAYQRIFGDEPLLGLWQNDLTGGLLWYGGIGFKARHVHDVGERRVDQDAIEALNIPSWTWMKMRGAMTTDRSPVINSYFTITNTKIMWSGVPLTSKIVEATITGSGKLLRVVGFERSERTKHSTDKCMCSMGTVYVEDLYGEKKEFQGNRFFVDECMPKLPDDIFCLLGHEEEAPSGTVGVEPRKAIRSLLVARESLTESLTTYSRIGVVSLVDVPHHLLDAMEEQNFMLV